MHPKSFLPIFLLITFTLLQSLQPVNASSSLSLTVNTDKNVYYLRENVKIYGTFQNDSSPISDTLVAIEVDDPPGKPIVLRTITIGEPFTPTVDVKNVFLSDEYGRPKGAFNIPIPAPAFMFAYFNVTLENSGPMDVTVAFTVYDNNTVRIGSGSNRFTPLPAGITSFVVSIPVYTWASTGTATIYANIYTNLPRLDGEALCPERLGNFEIIRGSGGAGATNAPTLSEDYSTETVTASGTDGTYECNFRLSPEPEIGTYTAYCNSKAGPALVLNTTTFEVESASYPPQADFIFTPPNPYVNGTVTFDASGSEPRGGTIIDYTWNFGDGSPPVTETDPVITHVYTAADTYTVTLNVTDSEGLWGTTSQPVTVSPVYGPTAAFTYSPPEPFVNGTTTFDASSSTLGWNGITNPPIVEYRWDFGDNTSVVIESDPVTTHIFRANATYTVTLKVTDTMGWWNTTSQNVTVYEAPPEHDIAITSVTYMPTVAYQSMTPPIDITVVVRNDGTIAETFNITAYYNVTATEWAQIETQAVTELDPLAETTVPLTWNTTTLPLYLDYTLKIETSTILNDTNPADNTVIAGNMIVKIPGDVNGDGMVGSQDLIFGLAPAYGSNPGDPNWNPHCDFDGSGGVESKDLIFGLAPNYGSKVYSPIASFTYSPMAPYTGEIVTFNASASYDPDGSIVSYFWDFGDDANDTGVAVDHAYADNGTYTVQLTVIDDDGIGAITTAQITVLNRPPVANFTESAETVYTGEVIDFDASQSSDPDGTIVTYFWDFGDDANDTGVTVDHAYADNGTYVVTLTVTDDDGATASANATKTVLNRSPVASFSENATTVLTGEFISFNASASYDPDGSVASYFWDFGDDTNATGVTVEHAYTAAGTYNVTLTVTDDDGATDSTWATKTVSATLGGGSAAHIVIVPLALVLTIVLVRHRKQDRRKQDHRRILTVQ